MIMNNTFTKFATKNIRINKYQEQQFYKISIFSPAEFNLIVKWYKIVFKLVHL